MKGDSNVPSIIATELKEQMTIGFSDDKFWELLFTEEISPHAEMVKMGRLMLNK